MTKQETPQAKFAVLLYKATRGVAPTAADLSFEAARKSAESLYESYKTLSGAGLATSGVSTFVVSASDAPSLVTEKFIPVTKQHLICYQCGGF